MSMILSSPAMATQINATVDFTDVLEKTQAAIDQVAANGTQNNDNLTSVGVDLAAILAQVSDNPSVSDLVAAQNAIIAALDQPGVIAAITSAGSGVEASITDARDSIQSTINNNFLSQEAKQQATTDAVNSLITEVQTAQTAIVAEQTNTTSKLQALVDAANNEAIDRAGALARLAEISSGTTLIAGTLSDILAELGTLLSDDDSVAKFGADFQKGVDSRAGSGKPEAGSACIVTIPEGWRSCVAAILQHLTPNKDMLRRVKKEDGSWTSWENFGQGASTGNTESADGFDVLKRRELQFWFPAECAATVSGVAGSDLELTLATDSDLDFEPDASAAPVAFTITDNGTDPAFLAFAGGYSDSGEVRSYTMDGETYSSTIFTNGTTAIADGLFFDSVADAIDANNGGSNVFITEGFNARESASNALVGTSSDENYGN